MGENLSFFLTSGNGDVGNRHSSGIAGAANVPTIEAHRRVHGRSVSAEEAIVALSTRPIYWYGSAEE